MAEQTVSRVVRGDLVRLTPDDADNELAQLLREPWLGLKIHWGKWTVTMDVIGRSNATVYATYFTSL